MYRMKIRCCEDKDAYLRINNQLVSVSLIVGNRYTIHFDKPTTVKDRHNNGREVILLGFDDDFAGNPIVRYVDTGRRGLASNNSLKPVE